jgi:PAS domain S-box-containing protein
VSSEPSSAVGVLEEENERLRARVRELEARLASQHDQEEAWAREALARSEARFRALIEAIPLLIAVYRDERYVYVNEEVVRVLGYDEASELVGSPVVALVHEDNRSQVLGRVQAITRQEVAYLPPIEVGLLRRDGGVVTAEVQSIAVLFDGLPSVVVFASDVTERRKIEGHLQRSARMEAVGRMAGGVAHDFNNLLFVIMNSAYFMLRRLPAGAPERRDAEQIHAASSRAAELTRQLLLFSRGAEPVAELLDVNAVIHDLARLLRGTLGEGIELRLVLARTPSHVRMAQANLEQVLVNLTVNARDAMPQGGVFHLEAQRLDGEEDEALGEVMIVARDSGVGMEQEVAAHAFEPFFTTKAPGAGTGLGLAITYGIIDKASGQITLESTPGVGTTFTIHLPLAAPPTRPKSRPRAALRAELSRDGQGETLLVVEDEAGVSRMLCEILEAHRYRVLRAASPPQALQVAAEHEGPIDLLISDVILPRMSGPELARELVTLRPGLRVLYMSGYTADALDRHGVRDGDLLRKPFEQEELLWRVRDRLTAAASE